MKCCRALTPPRLEGILCSKNALSAPHEFFKISQAESESVIPAYACDDHVGFEFMLPERGRPGRTSFVSRYQIRCCNTSGVADRSKCDLKKWFPVVTDV